MTYAAAPRSLRHPSFRGRIGIARADITPPVGIYARNWGAARHDVGSTIHRPLTLTAMTLAPAGGGEPLMFIDADLGWWRSLQTFRDFQSRLHETLSVAPANLIFALSHTHAAPPLMDADDSLAGSGLHRAWMKELFESTIRAVHQARESHFIGTIEWRLGRCGLAGNRDLPDPVPANERMICGYNPVAEADDTLLVGRITDANELMRATLVHYACHPTTLAWENEAISPDYVGAMRETLEHNTSVPAMFLLGACGDLAPRFQYVGDPEVADRHGRELGFAALSTLHGMEPPGAQLSYTGAIESGAPLAVWKHEPSESNHRLRAIRTLVDLRLKNWPSAEELEKQRQACTDRAFEERLRRKLNVRLSIGDGTSFQLPIHLWRIGDAVLVGSCCEAYSILARELRRRFPETTILCMNLLNGSIGYLPPAELYDQDAYTVWQTPFDRGSLERLLEAMTAAIGDVLKD